MANQNLDAEFEGDKSLFNSDNLVNYRNRSVGISTNNGISRIDESNYKYDGSPQISTITEEITPKLKPSDFVYSSYFNKLPTNRLVILRRFNTPISDQIPQGLEPMSTLVTYVPFDIDFLPEISISQNFESISLEDSMSGTGPKFSGGGGYDIRTLANILKTVTGNENIRLPQSGDLSDGVQHRDLLGPVNYPENIEVRGDGQESNIDFNYNFKYEMKYFSDVDPKLALIDLIANVIIMSIDDFEHLVQDNGVPFHQNIEKMFGDGIDSLGSVLSSGFLSQVMDTVKGIGDAISNFSVDSIEEGVKTGLGKTFDATLKTKKASQIVRKLWYAYTFLSGTPTSYWHLTVGNPFNPILTWGDLILESSKIKMSNQLGSNDFPVGFDAEISLKPARSLGQSEVIQKFNKGIQYYTKE